MFGFINYFDIELKMRNRLEVELIIYVVSIFQFSLIFKIKGFKIIVYELLSILMLSYFNIKIVIFVNDL